LCTTNGYWSQVRSLRLLGPEWNFLFRELLGKLPSVRLGQVPKNQPKFSSFGRPFLLFEMLPEGMTNSQWLALILGLFEIIIAAPHHLHGDYIKNATNHESIADPFFFNNDQGRFMWAAFVAVLGLQRLQYAFTPVRKEGKFHWPWVFLVATHCLETALWYKLAMEQPFWSSSTNGNTSIGAVNPRDMFIWSVTLSGEVQHKLTNFVMLVGVPLITLSFATWGP
jgi:hypothetical protein